MIFVNENKTYFIHSFLKQLTDIIITIIIIPVTIMLSLLGEFDREIWDKTMWRNHVVETKSRLVCMAEIDTLTPTWMWQRAREREGPNGLCSRNEVITLVTIIAQPFEDGNASISWVTRAQVRATVLTFLTSRHSRHGVVVAPAAPLLDPPLVFNACN